VDSSPQQHSGSAKAAGKNPCVGSASLWRAGTAGVAPWIGWPTQ